MIKFYYSDSYKVEGIMPKKIMKPKRIMACGNDVCKNKIKKNEKCLEIIIAVSFIYKGGEYFFRTRKICKHCAIELLDKKHDELFKMRKQFAEEVRNESAETTS